MSNTAVSATGSQALGKTVAQNLKSSGQDEKVANKVSSSLQDIENQLLEELSKSDGAKDSDKIQALQVKYQRALRCYEAFSTMMRNAHESMMAVIRNMRLS